MVERSLKALAALIFTAALIFGGNPANAARAGGTPTPARPSVSSGHIQIWDKYADMEAAYPILSGMTDERFLAEFNKAAEAEMRERTARLHADAINEYKNTAAVAGAFHPYEFESSVVEYMNKGSVLSFGIRMNIYTGGAHPFPDSRFFTIVDHVPAWRLTLPELFSDPAAGIGRLEGLIKAEMAKNPGEFFDNTAVSLDENTWFYLTGDELHIVFPAYSIAPGAAGEPDFGFDWALFTDIRNPGLGEGE